MIKVIDKELIMRNNIFICNLKKIVCGYFCINKWNGISRVFKEFISLGSSGSGNGF